MTTLRNCTKKLAWSLKVSMKKRLSRKYKRKRNPRQKEKIVKEVNITVPTIEIRAQTKTNFATIKLFETKKEIEFQQTANGKQQTANSKQQTKKNIWRNIWRITMIFVPGY